MSAAVVVLVEEPSARIVVDALCATLGMMPHVRVLQHDGKADLERSIGKKISGWRSPVPPRFVVSRDLDSADRWTLKAKLLSLVPEHARDRTKVRILVPELEAWYLGDPVALMEADLISSQTAERIKVQARFRDLCGLRNAKNEFNQILRRRTGALDAARRLGPRLLPTRNRSANFNAFVSALRWAYEVVENAHDGA